MTDLPHVTIYTDGACDPNPGPGGWAALIFFKSRRKEISGSVKESTNNRMELTAAIKALETLNRECEIDFYTDSEYLKRGITEWLEIWRARNWRRKGGALKNVDLWQTLEKLIAQHAIDWHWIRGHAGNRHNQRVDYLARKAIRR